MRRAEGLEIEWRLSDGQSTELLSNKRIQTFERFSQNNGRLQPNDIVVVWARHFLDDKIFFDSTKTNIQAGIRYLYILDLIYKEKFIAFVNKLGSTPSDRKAVIRNIDVIFVNQILTMGNYLLFSPDTLRSTFYAAVIYSDKPISWVRQSENRRDSFLAQLKFLIAHLAYAQAGSSGDTGIADVLFPLTEQVSDLREFGRKLAQKGQKPGTANFLISDVISSTDLSLPPKS